MTTNDVAGPIDGDQAFRRQDLRGPGDEAPYAGAVSFLRRNYTRDIANADVVVTGIPFDVATSGRPGARFGPRAIREASTGIAELPGHPFGFDPLTELAIADYGDCYLDYGHPEDAPDRITAHATEIIEQGPFLLSFGGDHFVTYPLLRAHAAEHGPLSLIHFDAHCDTWPDDGDRLDHGSMFLRAAREGIIDPSTSAQIGIRTPNSTDHGFTVLTSTFVHREGIAATMEIVREVVGDRPAYLTFDIDCLDPAYAPGTGTPVAGGLTSAQALEAVRSLEWADIRGADVVEVAPAYDHAEITAIAAATIAHDVICLRALRKGSQKVPYGRM